MRSDTYPIQMESYLTEQTGFKRLQGVAGDGILKVMHDDKVILKGKKIREGYYYLTESLV